MLKQFEAKGLKVIILDINPPAHKMGLLHPSLGARTSFYKLDLSQEDDIKKVADRIKEHATRPSLSATPVLAISSRFSL
ncbi:hypothetical protein FGADI_6506 [Fusarium gaditjirri]|uniref:Uncharacterized protein n=1 Tax=Fusarium gaditjirri TaxID=282569 RepID=A0A8H4T7K5_9HYPO|nr:hypothetical protein FGADI_6506 [Fusarium gaditjirri]